MLPVLAILFGLNLSAISSVKGYGYDCQDLSNLTGTVSDFADYAEDYTECWHIHVPMNYYVKFNVTKMKLNGMSCTNGYVELKNRYSTHVRHKFCSGERIPSNLTIDDDAEIIYHHDSRKERSSFSMTYHTEHLFCYLKNHFRCSPHYCIKENQVCDGVEDCDNGEDEIGCEKETSKITSIKGVNTTRMNTISWLKRQRKPSFGWGKNTHRVITALSLSGGATFQGNSMEEELIVKQLELETAVALLRDSSDPLTVNDLSMFINALLVTCHNPSKFYGYDLVQTLSERVSALKSANPASYLTLCHANYTFSISDINNLLTTLKRDSEYPFYIDIKAMAILAINCIKNKMDIVDMSYNETDSFEDYNDTTWNTTEITFDDSRMDSDIELVELYNKTLNQFMKSQQGDGRFGNVYTTSLVIQALLSSGEEHNHEWNAAAAVKYLIAKLNTSSLDILSTTLTLPVLNGKSLADIGKVNCSKQRRGGDEISEILDKLGEKVHVKYSLYIGDEKDIIHSIYLRLPENSSAYDVMRVAEAADPKYKFLHTNVSGKMYIYQIAGVTNDPEAGKFWLLYSGVRGEGRDLQQQTASPNKFTVTDGNHLVMWYRTVNY